MRLSKALFWPTTVIMLLGFLIGALTAVSYPLWALIPGFVALVIALVAIDAWIDRIGERWASQP